MNKLIKLSDTHYIIVDDSEVKENDSIFNINTKEIVIDWQGHGSMDWWRKITHSTQPLENINFVDEAESLIVPKIKPLSLSEVEKAIYGYSVEKMAYDLAFKFIGTDFEQVKYLQSLIIAMFKAHQELVKDNLFIKPKGNEIKQITREEANSVPHFQSSNGEFFTIELESLLSKTEWDIEFDEQSKITLL